MHVYHVCGPVFNTKANKMCIPQAMKMLTNQDEHQNAPEHCLHLSVMREQQSDSFGSTIIQSDSLHTSTHYTHNGQTADDKD